MPIGRLRERITIQTSDPVALAVTSLTRSGSTASATTALAHGLVSGDYALIAGASPTAYNGRVKVTVTGTKTFTHPVSGAPTTPATGTITVTYQTDAQGSRKDVWRDLATVWAEMIPLKAWERQQADAVRGDRTARFAIWVRSDVTSKMRLLWTPAWPSGAAQQTLEITGVLPDGDGRTRMLLETTLAHGV